MKNKAELIDHMITTTNDEGKDLTAWELGFMESITEQWISKGFLSDRQSEILEKIYAEKIA